MKTAGIKCTAAVLLLLFSQKLGLRLYMHNWFHVTQNQQAAADRSTEGQFHLTCDCFDEALMPLFASASINIAADEKIVARPRLIVPNAATVSFPKCFNALRGPPAAV